MNGASNILVIGIGNDHRGDDAVGLTVARRLKQQLPASVAIGEASGEGTALLEAWRKAALVILIDAVQSGATPGTIHRIDARAQSVPSNFFHYSTHAFGVAEAVELGRALGQLPPRLVIYGIEGETFAAGVGLSAVVEKAAGEVTRRVIEELRAATPGATPCTSFP
jgi:hydrogenase maturation protease